MSAPTKAKKSGGFQAMGLSGNILGGILKMGYKVPTPIQRKALPLALAGKDLVAMARTGSGKTAAFLIPILERLKEHSPRVGARALVLSPTRELAMQTAKFLKDMGKYTTLRYTLLVGGDSMELQFEALTYNPDIIVATPGRLVHHLAEVPNFTLSAVELVVFDEADRLFELGFADQIRDVMSKVSPDRQTMLFSATLPAMLVQFTRAGLKNPEMIRLDVDTKISENLRFKPAMSSQLVFLVMRHEEKLAILAWILRELLPSNQQAMVFCATRQAVDYVTAVLRKTGIATEAIYGAMEQTTRTGNLSKFRARKCRVLVVTDVAARGIDVPLLDNVINYDCPDKPKLFVHRTGRVARQGRIGTAFTLVIPPEMPYVLDLHLFLSRPVAFDSTVSYTLETMAASDTHCGTVPRKLLDVELESLRSFHDTTDVQLAAQSATNSYKMYSKTKADASKRSILRYKELEIDQVHPLFASYVGKFDKELDSFRKQLSNFRPPQVILEVECGKKGELLDMMKKKRLRDEKVIHSQQVRNALKAKAANPAGRDVMYYKPAAGGAGASEDEDEEISEGDPSSEGDSEVSDGGEGAGSSASVPPVRTDPLPSYLKKALRAGKKQKVTQFRDDKYFVSPEPSHSDAGLEVRESSAGVSRPGLSGAGLGNHHDGDGVAVMEDAVLDMMPDETTDMFTKRRVMHWDRRKKKFVQVTAGESAAAKLTGRRVRSESGAVVPSEGGKGRKRERGDIYKKWAKGSKRVIAGVGSEEGEAAGGREGNGAGLDWRAGRRGGLAPRIGNVAAFIGRSRGGAPSLGGKSASRPVRNELKSTEEVVKQRKLKLKEKQRLTGGRFQANSGGDARGKGGGKERGGGRGGRAGFAGGQRGGRR